MYLKSELDRVPDSLLAAGSEQLKQESEYLESGPVKMLFESGNLRYISIGGIEILRMMHLAIRDDHWNTIIPKISELSIKKNLRQFIVTYQASYESDKIHMDADVTIEGSATGKIVFSFKAVSVKESVKNRVGICVLHPLLYAGAPVKIIHSDSSIELLNFPKQVSPHQPFMDVLGMEWSAGEGIEASLSFIGDVFETEDHRNWADASFKTYSTPLSLPYPVTLSAGSMIEQEVILEVKADEKFFTDRTEKEDVTITVFQETKVQLPAIGVSQAASHEKLTDAELKWLKKIGLDHYRIDLQLWEESWSENFVRGNHEAKKLGLPLQVALYFRDDPSVEVKQFVEKCFDIFPQIEEIMLFQDGTDATPHALFDQMEALLREGLHHARIGVGTTGNFAEFNRNGPYPGKADFIVYALNPQEHASDNRTIIENLEALGYMVKTALHAEGARPVYVSPVTIGPRLPSQINPGDPRLHSLFGAGWAIGVIKQLSEAGAHSISLFETSGKSGFISAGSNYSGAEPQLSDITIYPVYLVLAKILDSKGFVFHTTSSDPFRATALVCKSGAKYKIFLVNHSADEIRVNITGLTGKTLSRILTLKNIRECLQDPEVFFNTSGEIVFIDPLLPLRLDPYSIHILEMIDQA